ncbi:hypothetical protein BpHYR1_045849 [Brachionus plicatilis]|uniref:Uncharacterized protein n=1 Tax=Brachionus plicatilis TaxID=10195 RepID=A0A3M7P9R7_BRAPC|nr:hypothetical protein BpHYR1_045849 [Brachionus plicatilis]
MGRCSTIENLDINKETLDPVNSNYFSNFDSAQNKKFQSLTRKLIELSIDLLDKSQLPSIQYIALSTINRIFDIYVYYNLFYPGYYESCYIPKIKRNSNRNNSDKGNVNPDSEKEMAQSVNFIQLKKPNRALKYCSCKPNQKSFHTNNLSRIKERNSTIQEDPSSLESQSQKNESLVGKSIKKRPELTKNSSLNNFTKRIGGFFRMLSFNSHLNSTSDSKLNSEPKTELICPQCKKLIASDQKNSNILRLMHLKSTEISEKEEDEEREEINENEPMFNYINSTLINKKIEKTKAEENKLDNNDLNSYYLNQPIKCLASSLEPKLESDKSVDINATTVMNSTAQQASTTGNSSSHKVKCLPSARTIQCQHHCVAILATRLFTILCNEQAFQAKLMNENHQICFNLIVDILYPNNDPSIMKRFVFKKFSYKGFGCGHYLTQYYLIFSGLVNYGSPTESFSTIDKSNSDLYKSQEKVLKSQKQVKHKFFNFLLINSLKKNMTIIQNPDLHLTCDFYTTLHFAERFNQIPFRIVASKFLAVNLDLCGLLILTVLPQKEVTTNRRKLLLFWKEKNE